LTYFNYFGYMTKLLKRSCPHVPNTCCQPPSLSPCRRRTFMSSILIVGGYGVVGHQAAHLLATRQPQVELLIGGRDPCKAAAVADALPRAAPARIDLDAEDPLAAFGTMPDLVLTVANDTHDRLLRSALQRGVALVDITRWTARVQDALAWAAAVPPRAPLVLASSWMAAVPATLAVAASPAFATLSRIDLDILYAMRDRAGPNSVEYLDRLATSFESRVEGRRVVRQPFSEARRVAFTAQHDYTTALFDSPDQMTLPALAGAATVTAHIGFDDQISNHLLRGLVRSGLWGAISGPAFTGLRRKLLYNPGTGGHHRVRVTLQGCDATGRSLQQTIDLDDPAGQTHLTAVGAVIQAERVLGLGGHAAARPGVQFAEALTDAALVEQVLSDNGVHLHRSERAS